MSEFLSQEFRAEMRDFAKAVRIFGPLQVLYWRLIYRYHMRLIHRYGRHQFTEMHPMPVGPNDYGHLWCQWCGKRVPLPPSPERSVE